MVVNDTGGKYKEKKCNMFNMSIYLCISKASQQHKLIHFIQKLTEQIVHGRPLIRSHLNILCSIFLTELKLFNFTICTFEILLH